MGQRASQSRQGHHRLPCPEDNVATTCLPFDSTSLASAGQEPFWLLIIDPPQQKFEVSDVNRYCWPDATSAEQRLVYRRMWRLLTDRGIARKLMDVMREESESRHPMFIAGGVPYNYYLAHRFHAPAPVPTNDIDIKVDIGSFVRQRLASCPDAPTSADRAAWSETEAAAFQAFMDEAIASFVAYAKRLMERFRAVLVDALPAIEHEFAPQSIQVPQTRVHVYHKTHAAPQGNNPPLYLVPLSGGVFQLMVELIEPGQGVQSYDSGEVGVGGQRAQSFQAGEEGEGGPAKRAKPGTFYWNVIDLETDWKTATVGGIPSPVEIAEEDPAIPEHGLRMLSADACRADLNGQFQVLKQRRRELKRAYWDWAVRWRAEYGAVPNGHG